MNKKELVKSLNKLLQESFEELEHSRDLAEEHYSIGWIDCLNAILKDIGEPTPLDVETVITDIQNNNKRILF
jgi:hypothetical protein